MTPDLDQLEALAKAALSRGEEDCESLDDWFSQEEFMSNMLLHPVDARFAEACAPRSILALIAEVRALRELVARIPATPEAMIAFIGPHFGSMEAQGWESDLATPAGDLSLVKYSLTVHDLLSAFDWADLNSDAINAACKEKA